MCGVAPARARVVSICCSPSSIAQVPFVTGRQRPLRRAVPKGSEALLRTGSSRNRGGVEEQGLGDRRLHGRALEGLGDQEGRLGTLAGQEPLREGGDEDDRNLELAQYVLDRVDARAVV